MYSQVWEAGYGKREIVIGRTVGRETIIGRTAGRKRTGREYVDHREEPCCTCD